MLIGWNIWTYTQGFNFYMPSKCQSVSEKWRERLSILNVTVLSRQVIFKRRISFWMRTVHLPHHVYYWQPCEDNLFPPLINAINAILSHKKSLVRFIALSFVTHQWCWLRKGWIHDWSSKHQWSFKSAKLKVIHQCCWLMKIKPEMTESTKLPAASKKIAPHANLEQDIFITLL